MKIAITLFVVITALCVLLPGELIAAGSGAKFRQRVSSGDEGLSSDIDEEVRFGREVAARVIARYGLYDNPKLMKYVNLVGHVISRTTNRPELEFHFAVLNTDEINAYAAPGGYVFVTRGALLRMRDEAELAGVLPMRWGTSSRSMWSRNSRSRGPMSRLQRALRRLSAAVPIGTHGVCAGRGQGAGHAFQGRLLPRGRDPG